MASPMSGRLSSAIAGPVLATFSRHAGQFLESMRDQSYSQTIPTDSPPVQSARPGAIPQVVFFRVRMAARLPSPRRRATERKPILIQDSCH